MSWGDSFTFVVEKPDTDSFAPKGGWKSEGIISPWTTGAASNKTVELQAYQTDEVLKKRYGIELAKAKSPFEAGCNIFGEETNKALWVSFNWVHDPIVVASRDAYLKTLELSVKPLDRDQLAAKILSLAEGEKIERNGIMVPTIEAKDRIAAYKLYSDIQGYTGKVEIDNSTNTFSHNEMTIKLVKADNKPVVIDNAPNAKSEMANDKTLSLPVGLKLVSGGQR